MKITCDGQTAIASPQTCASDSSRSCASCKPTKRKARKCGQRGVERLSVTKSDGEKRDRTGITQRCQTRQTCGEVNNFLMEQNKPLEQSALKKLAEKSGEDDRKNN